jgi:hypothetical protein
MIRPAQPIMPFIADILTDTGAFGLRLAEIFYHIVLPVLLLAATGFVLQRKLGLDMLTLKRLNFYFVMPAIIYFSMIHSQVAWSRAATVIGFTLLLLAAMAVLTLTVAALRGVPGHQRRTMLLTTILHNSGNFGLPLQKFAFRGKQIDGKDLSDTAAGLQAYVMITQNLFTFTIGILIAAGGRGKGHWKANLLHIVKFPPVYALAAAFATHQIRAWLGPETGAQVARGLGPFYDYLVYVKSAFIAVALLTLGAQLALVSKEARRYPVRWSVALRLLAGPAIGVALIYLLGLEGFVAQMLLISTSSPTAVNCMLLSMEFDNHPQYAARAVFYSTLLCPLTVTLVIYLAQGSILPPLILGT